ncbi:hypothetical protein VKT23_007974 [Stygiomarasmius scandens]|uniref:Cysteine-rich transmembrane CYSTM domain-containing protein n=1 Tax=Marasmiellus scandens TaxID=2682957 RepID=A0ABR1JLN9_9AGAR
MEPTKPTPAKTSQPQGAIQMSVVNPAQASGTQEQEHNHTHQHHKVARLRGGGAGKDCFLGLFGCFLCFECCEGCCDCVADIICCPCEMCC